MNKPSEAAPCAEASNRARALEFPTWVNFEKCNDLPAFRQVLESIAEGEEISDRQFQSVVGAALRLTETPALLAGAIGTRSSKLQAWSRGSELPNAATRTATLRSIRNLVDRRMRRLTGGNT